jgi:hypothetical protein
LRSYEIVATTFVDRPLDLYKPLRWPYPPTYLLWAVPANELAGVTGIPLHALIHLPAIAADAGIAWLVHRFLMYAVNVPRGAWAVPYVALFVLLLGGAAAALYSTLSREAGRRTARGP